MKSPPIAIDARVAPSTVMTVRRVVPNVETPDPALALPFYRDLLGLEVLMDLGFLVTLGSTARATVQISFAREGGSGTPVPDLSIEVDDLDAVQRAIERAGLPIEYGPVDEPWGVRRFFVRDPFGRLVNLLVHADDGGRR